MKLVRIVPFMFLAFLGTAGCKKAKEKSEGEKAVEAMEKSVSDFCACKAGDKECMDKAGAAGEEAENKLESMFEDESKAPKDLVTRAEAAEEKLKKCAEKMGDAAENGDTTATGNPDDKSAEATKTLDEMTALKDEICKCTDMACAEPHGAKLEPLENKLKELYPDKASVPADLMKRGEDIETALKDCMAKMGGEAPPPAGDPAAEATKTLDMMAAMKDEICKCADMACAQPIGEKLEVAENQLKALYPDKASVPPELMARGEEIEKQLGECMAKMGGQ